MKKFLTMLVAMLAMVSFGMANPACWPNCGGQQDKPCSDGTCDYNNIIQTNIADATSGQAYTDVPSWFGDNGLLKVEQTQKNCAAVLGEGNSVTQNNKAVASGTAQKQLQDNVAMVVGYSNMVIQSNDALATGLGFDGTHGIYEEQAQKNLMLIIGSNNYANQKNKAMAFSDSPIWPAYPIKQDQKNIGLLLGKKNALVQFNDADATMKKCIEVDPQIKQIQKNIAFAVNNCDDCKVDTSFTGTTTFTWPSVTAPAPAVPAISCPTGSVCDGETA